jgi:Tol biopolymer transport system component
VPSQVDCDAQGLVCQAGACVAADPCAPPACSSPPANACDSATVLRAYPSVGSCVPDQGAPSCTYTPALLDCTALGQVCDAGACAFPVGPCDVPPDGDGFLLYASDAGGDYDLRAVRLDGSCDQPFAGAAGDDLGPSWSAASGVVAWSGVRGGSTRIVTLDLLGAAGETVLDTGPDASASPAFSPDGQSLAFERRAVGGTADVLTVPVAGGATATLSASPITTESGPVWAPDGLSVYIVADLSSPNEFEVWRIPVGGGAPVRVTTDSHIQGKPDVSPDGTMLAYASDPGTGVHVVVRDLGTGAERILSQAADSEPAFHAGGSLIAVRTQRFSVSDVVLLDVATGALVKRLTDGGALVGTPAFPR